MAGIHVETSVPFARITVPEDWPESRVLAVADGVYRAMLATINIPEGDRFQTVVSQARRIADPAYLGVERSPDVVFVDITLVRDRTDDQKKALYRTLADDLHAHAGVRREDVFVVLTENSPIDWSFGAGEAQAVGSNFHAHWKG